MQTELLRVSVGVTNLVGTRTSVEFAEAVVIDCAGRPVLIHDVEERVDRQLLGEEAHHALAAGETVRQHEVTHEQAANGDAALVEHKVADLPVHLADGAAVHLRVVGRGRKLLGSCVISRICHSSIAQPEEVYEQLWASCRSGNRQYISSQGGYL